MLCPICHHHSSIKKSVNLPRFYTCLWCSGNYLKTKIAGSYPKTYFVQDKAPSVFAKLADRFFEELYQIKINNILDLVDSKDDPKILDYGCGLGKLVEMLRGRGVKAYGYEPSAGALMMSRKKKLPVYQKLKVVKGGYDLIMLWHSLEHTGNPFRVVQKLKKLLKRGGKLLLAVPNADSFEVTIARDKWFHYTYPLHLIHFTPKSIRLMLESAKFNTVLIDFFNPEYTTTGLLQSFLNLFLPKDVLYSCVCHRRIYLSSLQAFWWSVVSILLAIIFLPLLIIFYLVELIFKKTDAMVVIAQNNGRL